MDFVGQFLANADCNNREYYDVNDENQVLLDPQRFFTPPLEFLQSDESGQPVDFSLAGTRASHSLVSNEAPFDLTVKRQDVQERQGNPRSMRTVASEDPVSRTSFRPGIPVPFKIFAKPASTVNYASTAWTKSTSHGRTFSSDGSALVPSVSNTSGSEVGPEENSDVGRSELQSSFSTVHKGLPVPILRKPASATGTETVSSASAGLSRGLHSARSVQFSVEEESDADSNCGRDSSITGTGGGAADKQSESARSSSTSSQRSRQEILFPAAASSGELRPAVGSGGMKTASSRRHESWSTPKSATPRRSIGSSGKSSEQDHLSIVAMVEGRGYARGEVGLAALYLASPKMVICQLSDSPMYNRTATQLNVFNPVEIIIPASVADNSENNHLTTIVRRNFPNTPVTCIPRKFFSEQTGLQFIKKLAMSKCESVHLVVSQKYYALAAVSALWRYVEYSQNSYYASKSVHISYQGMEMSTFIDSHAALKLELVTSQLGPNGPSLYSSINCCKTAPGARLLRASILQPTRLVGVLEQRHEAVNELLQKPELFFELRGLVSRFGDVGRILSGCIQIPKSETMRATEQRINLVIGIKQALTLLQPLREAVKETASPLFRAMNLELADTRFNQLLEKISEVISDEAKIAKGAAAMRLQRCFAIKSGVNQILEIARKAYCEIVEDMSAYVADLAKTHDLNLKLSNNTVRGFHCQMVLSGKGSEKVELPQEFIQVNKGKSVVSFTTDTLMLLDRRSSETLGEINRMSGKILEELLGEVRNDICCLYGLSEAIATIDLVTSFAHVASSRENYACPIFEDKIAILNGRHPVLERSGTVALTSNSTFLAPNATGMVITGSNMGGKTTYLLQVALLQILAQIGSFVPAEFATFKIVDQILIRFGSSSVSDADTSTFANEMNESSFIVQNATADSLVLVDELCRSTSKKEGAPLAFSILEAIRNTGCLMVVTTHEPLITKLAEMYTDINNYHMETEEIQGKDGTLRLGHTHRLVPGTLSISEYGLRLAEASGFPESVTNEAWQISVKLANQVKAPIDVATECRMQKLKSAFVMKLTMLARQLALSRVCDMEAYEELQRLKAALVDAATQT